ncbi:hypothetical protein [Candidatus Methanoprimaticola sp. MG2]|uniref:hypothetical protein n=1 Tax=Candidatus Methanoprimaticola sp. MG2 TaxID=3228838 RepID=UPI0039C6C236
MTGVREFMHDILQPGETIVVAGRRGHGKTATVISIAQHVMEGDYGHGPAEIITNIKFGRVRKGLEPVEDYPSGVHYEDTLAGTLRKAGEIIREYGPGGCTILWLLDEAQNYMMADENGRKENLALTKYLGNARKFDICNIFMTPVLNNLTPRVRCFPTGESKSGYCSLQMIKDKDLGAKVAGSRADPRSITFVRMGPGMGLTPMFISPMPWIRSIYSGLPDGSYGYDTKAMATFSIGANDYGVPFSLEEFLKVTSKGLSHELPDKIDEYFDRWESMGSGDEEALPGEDHSMIRISDQCRRIERMRAVGLKWREIADIEGEVMTTIQSRFYKYAGIRPSSGCGDASILMNDEQRVVGAGAYIYNPKRGGGPEGSPSLEGGEA